MRKSKTGLYINVLIFIYFISPSVAQITPDSSLGTNNSVTTNSTVKGINSQIISGGATSGSNLLHSFKEFNINIGTSAYFSNPVVVQNIIARVTGINSSKIYGTLGVLGNANLFLLSPNGILFGPDSKLDLNGSFLASTAESIQFNNGYTFNSVTANQAPLIQINTPVGLNFSANKGKIVVQGSGHNLVTASSAAAPLTSLGTLKTGLSVSSGKTLAFVSENINFIGGIATAPSGNIYLSSVVSGIVGININIDNNLSLDLKNVIDRGDLSLSNLSLLNASGLGNENISLFGRKITITDNSLVLISSIGASPSGSIFIDGSELFSITGATANTVLNQNAGNGLRTEALGSEKGANINIFTPILTVQDAGKIYTQALSKGDAGDINLDVSKTTSIFGNSIFNPSYATGSIIISSGLKQGKSGNIKLKTTNLIISNGGLLSSVGYSSSDGGDVSVTANNIQVDGYNSISFTPSQISAITQGTGKGGSLTINTDEASFDNGGSVLTATQASGSAGDLVFNATKSINLNGSIPGSLPSSISATALLANPIIRKAFGLPPSPTGKSGNLIINTPLLKASNNAAIVVRNEGSGDAGILKINAGKIILQNGNIFASTKIGNGGEIVLNTHFYVSQGGTTTAAAGGNGNGGNLSINSNVIFGDSNSFLSANADQGVGGQIKITSTGFIFPRNNISAKSNAGSSSDGRVVISASATQINQSSLFNPALAQVEFLKGCKPDQRKSLEVVNGSGIAPEQLTDPIENFSSSQNTYYRLDLKTRQKIPLGKPMLSWKDNGDGTSSAISELSEPSSVSSLPTFYCFDSNFNSAKAK